MDAFEVITDDPPLRDAFPAEKRPAEGSSHLMRVSGRYPLHGRGDVNAHAVFNGIHRRFTFCLLTVAGRAEHPTAASFGVPYTSPISSPPVQGNPRSLPAAQIGGLPS